MTTVCPFHRAQKSQAQGAAPQAADRETEFLAILTAAEQAFDEVYCAHKMLAA